MDYVGSTESLFPIVVHTEVGLLSRTFSLAVRPQFGNRVVYTGNIYEHGPLRCNKFVNSAPETHVCSHFGNI